MKRWSIGVFVVAVLIGVGQVDAEISVLPVLKVEVYANLHAPGQLAFDPFGNLYAGRGGTGPTRIWRIAPGGSPVTEYGNSPINDPDAVAFDAAGTISGVPGSVLVAGVATEGVNQGQVVAIHPDESVHTVFGTSSPLGNPSILRFDDTGRLLIADFFRYGIFESTGGPLSTLFELPAHGAHLAVDPTGRIFTSAQDGVIRIHATDGGLIDPAFASGLPGIANLEFGPGGLFGTELYVIARGGNLLRFDEFGNSTLLGSGFGPLMGNFTFGSDGALYFPDHSNDRIYRMTVIPEPSSIITWSLIGMTFATIAWWRQRRKG